MRPATARAAHRAFARRLFARLGAGGVLLTLALSGCAPEPDPGWTPQPRPAAVVVDAVSNTVDPASEPALNGYRLRSAAVNVAARWATVLGASTLNARLHGEIRAAIESFTADHGTQSYRPGAAERGAGLGDRGCVPGSTTKPAAELFTDPAFAAAQTGSPALVIACDIVLAAGPYLAERLRIVTGTVEAVESDRSITLIADTASGELVAGSESLRQDATPTLWRAAVEQARSEAGALWPTEIAAPDQDASTAFRESLGDITLDPDGGLVVTATSGLRAAELEGLLPAGAVTEPLTFRVAAEQAAEVLVPAATAVVSAADAGEAFAAPAADAAFDRVDCTLVACAALTYDDGPDSTLPRLLELLQESKAGASFFVIGNKVAGGADALRAAAQAGYEIGNHSFTHPDFGAIPVPQPPPAATPSPGTAPGSSAEPSPNPAAPTPPAPTPAGPVPGDDLAQMRTEIDDTSAAIRQAIGVTPTLFRPPYGSYDDRLFEVTSMPVILWDVDTNDWQQPGIPTLIDRAVGEADAGSIILMHSTQQDTIDATPHIIDGLRDRGIYPVTVSRLFEGAVPAGVVIHR